jgi:transposase InsO family protein
MTLWMTAREFADANLPGLPSTERGMRNFASDNGWDDLPMYYRARQGRGGGREYSADLLPRSALMVLMARQTKINVIDQSAAKSADEMTFEVSNAAAAKERDARLAIVSAYKRMTKPLNLSQAATVLYFVSAYNAQQLQIEKWVFETVKKLSSSSLKRWLRLHAEGKGDQLAVDRSTARKGKGILHTANGGAVRKFILSAIAAEPHLSAKVVRKLVRSEFGDTIEVTLKGVQKQIEVPPVRTFQYAISQLKEENHVVLTKLTNPDLYRSTMAPSGTGTLSHVTEPNALWQIDASPVDALCLDGRYSLYACIDIATRRTIITISRTPRASAVMLMLRKAILEWGLPHTIKTDNGSDFVAQDTKRLFNALGIEMELSDAYSPQQKGHVERVIKTFQHEVGPQLPGFIGHSVTDRKAIESRKSFAARLGESDLETFGVELDAVQLQSHIDGWLEFSYQHAPHGGLSGQSPANAALRPHDLRSVNERALDVLLMPVAGKDGLRRVTKMGIRVNDRFYMIHNVLPGETVFVRMDPIDMSKAYVFSADASDYIGEAVCPELSGVNPQAYASTVKRMHREMLAEAAKDIKAGMRQLRKGPAIIERTLEVDKRDAPNVISIGQRSTEHHTPELDAAASVNDNHVDQAEPADDLAFFEKPAEVISIADQKAQRYRRAVGIRTAIEKGISVSEDDAEWFRIYREGAEYRGNLKVEEAFGDAFFVAKN